jgi:hypothetical protein
LKRAEEDKTARTTNKTFRLDKSAARLLEQESKERDLSANAIVNELILKNLRREREFRSMRTFPVSVQTLRILTEELSDEKVVEIGKRLVNDELLKEFYFRIIGNMTPENILQAMKRNYETTEAEHGGKKVLILALYAGRKWSLLTGILWQTILASAGMEVKFSADENAVIFEYDSKAV